mmetsp:Transcript_20807/g.30490  ORF Transcript_20807/g.30490 Transcript_20807/m.30490 type:complete len:418 (-) Transcript_20807:57-1310(-)
MFLILNTRRTKEGNVPFQVSTPATPSTPIVSSDGDSSLKTPQDRLREVLRSPSDYFPMIKRGQSNREEKEDEVVSVGWNVEVTNRKEREISLRDDAHQFELKLNKFSTMLEQGIEVTMWQMNRNNDFATESTNVFTLKGTQIQLKLFRRGEFLVQAALTFSMKGGYLSKAINRRKFDKSALEPLSVTEILEVKAGCDGYDQSELPSASRKSKKGENKHGSLFITLKASPTPIASSRLYFLKFKSRGIRNDILNGLRGLLAELQIKEGVNISSTAVKRSSPHGGNISGSPIRTRSGERDEDKLPADAENILVPLSEVHSVIDAERQSYDRLLLMMLQSTSDLKRSEDDMVGLRGTLDAVIAESKEKDRIQTNDSKLIMQLSKKMETLLMDNEDLRDQNETLNHRIITLESEKVGVYET